MSGVVNHSSRSFGRFVETEIVGWIKASIRQFLC
jgi:hypothetical protein